MPHRNRVDRRRFMGTTVGTVAGAALAAGGPAAPTPAHGGGEKPPSGPIRGGQGSHADPIRVGLIRCDTHGIYFAALMSKHDPLLLMNPPRPHGAPPVHSWQGGGVHLYFYTSYYDRAKMTVPSVDGFEIVKVWDENVSVAETLAAVCYGKPKVCRTFAEVSDDVDLVFIADCNGDGSDHLKLCSPGLEKGIPTYVDKPFAYDFAGAVALVDKANRHGVPLMSLSILRVLPQASLFRQRFAELGDLQFGTIVGGGESMAGHIHAIALAHHLFGAGVEAVECMGSSPLAYVHLDYAGRPERPPKGVVLNCASGTPPHAAMYASAYGSTGDVHSPPLGDFVFPYGAAEILRRVKIMVRTGSPQVDGAEVMESIAIATAARLAQQQRRRVRLQEVM